MFWKKPKTYSGYTLALPLSDGIINFYNDAPINRVLNGEKFRVDKKKILQYEQICEVYRKNYQEMGWLRLHIPLSMYQEYLGTDFLYVPPKERTRISEMLGGGSLITLERFKSFQVVGSEKTVSIDELSGSCELIDITKVGSENRELLEKGIISQEEMDKRTKSILENNFYFIFGFSVSGMFIINGRPD
jgi:hypothetical protein